jgi:hypothetical protein
MSKRRLKMKKIFTAILLCVWIMAACTTSSYSQPTGISASDVAGAPTEYCKVLKEPDPAFLGGWKVVYNRYVPKTAEYMKDFVEFYLVKHGDKYGIYFYRAKSEGEEKIYRGWREWTINGDEIFSETGVKFIAKDGQAFYSWKNDKPVQMTRIEGLR